MELYSQRWRIETAFREMKIWHGLESFHSRTVAGIAQEIAVVMIFLLLAGELAAKVRCAQPEPEPPPSAAPAPTQPGEPPTSTGDAQTSTRLIQPDIRFNRRIVALICTAMLGKDLREAFDCVMFRIWRYRQKVRRGRTFPRRRKSAPRGWKTRGTKGKGRS